MNDARRLTGVGYACGKAIVLGEHAVVYGVPAIAVGIDRGARAHARPIDRAPSQLYIRGWDITVPETDDRSDLGRAFRALLESARGGPSPVGPHAVEVEAHLPPGGGLGCSAAIGVAVARALEPRIGDPALQERAMAWERVFHGNPSGVDAAVSARGGCVVFRRGAGLEPVRVRGAMHLCIGSTGIASSTKTMVEAVANLRSTQPRLVEASFEAIRALVHNARGAIESGDRVALGRLMDHNQAVLASLFVSTPDIERLCTLARDAGALGAKLTGAGGGGSVLALVASQAASEAVLTAWHAAGFDGFATCVSPETRPVVLESESAP